MRSFVCDLKNKSRSRIRKSRPILNVGDAAWIIKKPEFMNMKKNSKVYTNQHSNASVREIHTRIYNVHEAR